MKKITIIEYGCGNILNLIRAIKSLGYEAEITHDKKKNLNSKYLNKITSLCISQFFTCICGVYIQKKKEEQPLPQIEPFYIFWKEIPRGLIPG